jgi:hypothetical protein
VSEAYGGRTTHSQITTSSNFLLLLEAGHVVLADKDFTQLKTLLDDSGKALLVMSPFLRNEVFTANLVSCSDPMRLIGTAPSSFGISKEEQRMVKFLGFDPKLTIKYLLS